MGKGLFITAEGTDGCGKTTQIKLMKDYLESRGLEVVLAREPGGTAIGEKIRTIILDRGNAEMCALAEMLLYAAARAQLVSEVIKPAIFAGKTVICDRFVDSSYAYQGFGRGIDMDTVANVNMAAVDGMMPDMTFFFDVSPGMALARREASTGMDRIEKESMDFHTRVHLGYKKLASLYPGRIKAIDGARSVEAISEEVRGHLDKLMEKIRRVGK